MTRCGVVLALIVCLVVWETTILMAAQAPIIWKEAREMMSTWLMVLTMC